jgi:hypothetical protein
MVGFVVAALIPTKAAWAQLNLQAEVGESSSADPSPSVPLQVVGEAAVTSEPPTYHIMPARTEAGSHAPLEGPIGHARAKGATTKTKSFAGLPSPGFFPADLSDFGGPKIGAGDSVDIYYNCPTNDKQCWGDPEGFLINLSNSRFIHVVDQYVGSASNRRYPLFKFYVYFPDGSLTSLVSSDVEDLVHQAALLPKIGPEHLFHLFLPKGVDVCTGPNNCYSPDNPSTFTFCGYHSFVTFSDTGTLFYSVQPYEDVNGCVLHDNGNGYPNGELDDSTNSVLSHELFETITDPLVGQNPAWIAASSAREDGQEVGDICQGPFDANGAEFTPIYQLVPRHFYQTQLEYSNFRHGCVNAP